MPTVLSTSEKAALRGTFGTPSTSNKYVTDTDPRFAGPFTPAAHKTSHEPGGTDVLTALTNASIAAAAGIVESKLALNFATHSNTNDPSSGEKAALVGTAGTPSSTNKYVTNDDSRNTDARTPVSHVLATEVGLGGTHTISGATAGHVLRASSATAAAFAQLQYSDLGGVPSSFTPSAHASTHIYQGTDQLVPPVVIGSTGLTGDITTFIGNSPRLASIGDNLNAHLALGQYGANTAGVTLQIFKTRATTADMSGNTAVTSGDSIFTLTAHGSDGIDYDLCARIAMVCEGTIAAGQVPGRIVLSTSSTTGTLTERMRIDSNGLVSVVNGSMLIGSLAGTGLHANLTDAIGAAPGYVSTRSGSAGQHHFTAHAYAAAAGGPTFSGFKSRRTTDQAASTAAASGDTLLRLVGYGADGTNYQPGAEVKFEVDGTVSGGDMPGRIVFSTTLDGGSTLNERLRIDQTGTVRHTGAANGQFLELKTATITVTCSGATSEAASLIPAGSLVLGVTVRVTTAITGATSFGVGDTTSATIYGTSIAIAAGTTTTLSAQSNRVSPLIYNTATSVRLTANGSNFTGGVVRVTVHYINLSAATS